MLVLVARARKQPMKTSKHYCWEVVDDVGMSFGSCQAIFKDVLGKKRMAANIVPKLLNFVQLRMDIAQEMWTMTNDDPDLLKRS